MKKIVDQEIIHLKTNNISKGLVTLQELFDINDIETNLGVTFDDAKVEDCNIGT
jgi:hypothetical protein